MDQGDGHSAEEAAENYRQPAASALLPAFVPWSPPLIRNLLLALAKEKIDLFAINPDLLQVAERAMAQAWARWNPARSGLSTYLYAAASNAII